MSHDAEERPGAARPDRLQVRSEVRGPCLLVEADGEMTLPTAGGLRERVLADMTRLDGPPRVVLDIGGVGFCDSSGLNALIVLWKAARAGGGELVLARPERRFRTIIERSGLDRHLIAYETPEQALAALCGS
ncbi:STAS domain-containing protein [Actinomadura sp. KC216]|uniref:STAS domain-containing protein n=1 Tax=Actinomadura sp. KC216 TaxID=2530370 RepID=UPI0014046423|nr:STAS domain-containing protein [Actinomadura sp. KC216]